MNVLFFLRIEAIPTLAGVERVTNVLSQFFINKGMSVSYLYYAIKEINDTEAHKNINVFYLPNQNNIISDENENFINHIVAEKQINILINQSIVGNKHSKLLNKIYKNENLKIISVLHGTPYSNNQFRSQYYQSLSQQSISIQLIIKKLLPKFTSYLYYKQYCSFLRNTYNNSNIFLLLSKGYIPLITKYIKVDKNKLHSIANPLSFDVYLDEPTADKENIVLYVGRLEYSAKRIDRLLHAWSKLYIKHRDWKLVIVGGDGGDTKEKEQKEELLRLTELTKTLNLERIEFANRQNPKTYYEKSKIFCMTSSYEGFPMVLGEAMQYGLVPVVFDSFAAVTDIIDNQQNGMIVKSFNIDEYANAIEHLIKNKDVLLEMSKNAIIKSKEFEIDRIGHKWLDLFKEITV